MADWFIAAQPKETRRLGNLRPLRMASRRESLALSAAKIDAEQMQERQPLPKLTSPSFQQARCRAGKSQFSFT
jgi:hypothetical protein